MTLEEFGQTIKAKYPQYAAYSDSEIGQKMLAKYPQYQSQISQSQTPPEPPHQNPLLNAAKTVAKGLADPFLRLGATANALGTSKFFLGKGADLKPQNTPLGPVKPITTAKEAAGTLAELGGYAIGNPVASGALFSGGAALTDDKPLKQVALDTAIGAGTGLATVGASKVLGKLKNFVTDVAPESLMNHAVKPTLDELRKNIKYGDATLGKQLVNEGVKGSPKGLLTIADKQITQTENQLQSLLQNSTGMVQRSDLEKYLQPAIKKLENTPGAKKEIETFSEILNDFPESVPVAQANEIKRNIYDKLRDVAFKINPNLSTSKEAMKVLARGLKTEIENQSGNPNEVALLNRKSSIYGRLEDRVVDQLARANRNQLVTWSDAVIGSIGFSHPLAFLGLVAKHGAQSTRVLTNTAVGLNKLGSLGEGAAGQLTKTAAKKILVNLPSTLSRRRNQ